MGVTKEAVIDRFAQPQFVLALALIAIFAGAYFADLSDETMKGAIIAGFSGAWGYYLGSSRGAVSQTENVGKALDLANGPKQVEVTNTEKNPVPVSADDRG